MQVDARAQAQCQELASFCELHTASPLLPRALSPSTLAKLALKSHASSLLPASTSTHATTMAMHSCADAPVLPVAGVAVMLRSANLAADHLERQVASLQQPFVDCSEPL
ncbi:hypothetical protein PIB30_064491 [Stylosanthes scabra]|uniref:Uncharacterized protein n=1 Tax=Stylosanthes scabra TaxID=79078 RepID=A0ABU6TLG4_9FABA|nr:hypothetical protein [Stylosanthes scabra]